MNVATSTPPCTPRDEAAQDARPKLPPICDIKVSLGKRLHQILHLAGFAQLPVQIEAGLIQ